MFQKNRLMAPLRTVGDYLRYRWFYLRQDYLPRPILGDAFRDLQEDGFAVVDNYLSSDRCAELRGEVDSLIEEYPEYVQVDEAESDQRVFGAEYGSSEISTFNEDRWLEAMAHAYLGEDASATFTLANRVDFVEGNLGSGGGWHRDSFGRQFKALLYLSDVGPENGPFQFIRNSHRFTKVLEDILRGQLDYGQNRIPKEAVDRILNAEPGRLETVTASAGTLLIINTAVIHRGAPIEQGTRYALTNYYHPTEWDKVAIISHFAPVLGHSDSAEVN